MTKHFSINNTIEKALIQVLDKGQPYLLTNSTVVMNLYKPNGTVYLTKTLTITDAALGKCEWAPLTGEMSVPGVYACRLAITKTNPNGYVELPVEEFRID